MFSKKTCGLPSNRPRATNGRPYRFGGFLNVMPVGEGSPLPTNLCKNGRRNASPTDQISKSAPNLVGTGVLDGPKKTGRRGRQPLPILRWFWFISLNKQGYIAFLQHTLVLFSFGYFSFFTISKRVCRKSTTYPCFIFFWLLLFFHDKQKGMPQIYDIPLFYFLLVTSLFSR